MNEASLRFQALRREVESLSPEERRQFYADRVPTGWQRDQGVFESPAQSRKFRGLRGGGLARRLRSR